MRLSGLAEGQLSGGDGRLDLPRLRLGLFGRRSEIDGSNVETLPALSALAHALELGAQRGFIGLACLLLGLPDQLRLRQLHQRAPAQLLLHGRVLQQARLDGSLRPQFRQPPPGLGLAWLQTRRAQQVGVEFARQRRLCLSAQALANDLAQGIAAQHTGLIDALTQEQGQPIGRLHDLAELTGLQGFDGLGHGRRQAVQRQQAQPAFAKARLRLRVLGRQRREIGAGQQLFTQLRHAFTHADLRRRIGRQTQKQIAQLPAPRPVFLSTNRFPGRLDSRFIDHDLLLPAGKQDFA